MIGLVFAACLLTSETDVSPALAQCSLLLAKPKFDTVEMCESYATAFVAEFNKDKAVRIDGHKCFDMSKVKVTPVDPKTNVPNDKQQTPMPNPTDPKLKPISPEQKKEGFQSL